MTDTDESLRTMLARSGTAPDYTMGALQKETGVPPETLRSWERRHGFPTPSRTPSNHRLYSERDVVAVRWLLGQIENGKGTSPAIAILKRNLPGADSGAAVSSTSPLDDLLATLRQADLAAAQARWDDLVLGLSPAGIERMLLRLDKHGPLPDRAQAFLLRKATVLLDAAGPDTGETPIAIITSGQPATTLPATVAAAALARNGIRILIPFPDTTSLAAIGAVREFGARHAVLVGISRQDASTLAAILPDVALHHWNQEIDSLDQIMEFRRS